MVGAFSRIKAILSHFFRTPQTFLSGQTWPRRPPAAAACPRLTWPWRPVQSGSSVRTIASVRPRRPRLDSYHFERRGSCPQVFQRPKWHLEIEIEKKKRFKQCTIDIKINWLLIGPAFIDSSSYVINCHKHALVLYTWPVYWFVTACSAIAVCSGWPANYNQWAVYFSPLQLYNSRQLAHAVWRLLSKNRVFYSCDKL